MIKYKRGDDTVSVVCPYCKNYVDEEFQDKVCPVCGEMVKSKEWIDAQVSSYIRFLKRNNMYDTIKLLIWNDENSKAIDKILSVVGKKDVVVLERFISITKLKKPDSYINTDVFRLTDAKHIRSVNLVECITCGNKISPRAPSCPRCGNPTGVHVCPKCDSLNTRVITGTSKAASIFLWGAFAANKVVSKYECKDCGHKF